MKEKKEKGGKSGQNMNGIWQRIKINRKKIKLEYKKRLYWLIQTEFNLKKRSWRKNWNKNKNV